VVSNAVPAPILQARGVEKHFAGVYALAGVDFEILPGECVGLIGDNGAGKSTLVKILSGALHPDNGDIMIDGQRVTFHSPHEARDLGIETVYQDLALASTLDATTNMFLGREVLMKGLLGQLGFVDRKAMRSRAGDLLQSLSGTVRSLDLPVNSLSGGQRQSVAIARALAWGQRVLLLDEPMAALGVTQSGKVVELIRRLRAQGSIAIVLISHDLPRVFEVADRLIVLRQGRRVATMRVEETSMDHVVGAMTGAVN